MDKYGKAAKVLKKFGALLLIAALAASAAACQGTGGGRSESTPETAEAVQTDIEDPGTEDPETEGRPSMIDGGWEMNRGDMTLEEEHLRIFEEGVDGLTGERYTPIVLLAKQAVAGTNYCFLARVDSVSTGNSTRYYLVYIYEDPQGNARLAGVDPVGDYIGTSGMTGAYEANAGSWDINDSENAEVKAAFEKALDGLTGAGYEPVAYIERQLVAGMNYGIICRVTAVVPDAEPKFALVYIYADLQGNARITETEELYIEVPPDYYEMQDA